ncbi:MAG TPA: ATP-grasp domain-containing protein [Azospirillum sp.]|nr:ATP-grasp domain-containing protein [Azospirillum sp.]
MPPATSPADPPDVIVTALSARALAAASARAGRRPAAVDLFADVDTRQFAAPCIRLPAAGLRLDADALLAALSAPALRGVPLVYGAGFEDDPPLLARIAADRPLLGNPAEVVARAKDPFAFAALAASLGIPHPEVLAEVPGRADGYLLKRIGGSGGSHVRPATTGAVPPGWYVQRRVGGHPVSVLFLADGQRTVIVGMSRQWASPAPDSPCRYGGAAGPLRLPERLSGPLSAMVARLAAALGLIGLNSADFLVAGHAFHLLEVNPRPGASLDVFDREPMPPLFALHIDACAGRLPERLPSLWGCRAAAVHYAPAPVRIGGAIRWPAWTADRPVAPARIAPGEPVCTVLADGASVGSARRRAEQRRRYLAERLPAADTMELQP